MRSPTSSSVPSSPLRNSTTVSMSDSIPSSPPGPGTSLEESLKFYKAQYELLETELADFQSSSKDLEAELEKDIEAAEKRERQLKDKASSLQYEVDEWKEKYRQAKTEATAAQNALQKEVTKLRDDNRTLQLKLRDIEVANDDFERQQRNTESSLEDMQQQYNQAFEKAVLFEQEVQKVEQEREDLRIDVQRLKDEYQDFKIEADITKEKLKKAEERLNRRSTLSVDPVQSSETPRSELSPTTTNTSSPSFDTPPAKTASSSGVSDTLTPPSPPISETSAAAAPTKPITTPHASKPRVSVNTTPRQPTYSSRPNGHTRGLSSAVTVRTGPAYRQSLSKSVAPRASGLPQSSSIMQLRNLRGKMQNLEQRVQRARSKLPGPVDTPPRASPRSGGVAESYIPSSVTVRSRKRTIGSNMGSSQPDSDTHSTPSISRVRSSRQSLTQQFQAAQTSPSRNAANMPPPRPSSRASGISSRNGNAGPTHSRPNSRTSGSISMSHSNNSSFRAPLGGGAGNNFAPNASTDRITARPQSSLSDYRRTMTMYDGALDEEDDNSLLEDSQISATATPTPRRSLLKARTSDVGGSSIPSPTKRQSLSTIGGIGFSGGTSITRKLPGPTRRQSHSNLTMGSYSTSTNGGGSGSGSLTYGSRPQDNRHSERDRDRDRTKDRPPSRTTTIREVSGSSSLQQSPTKPTKTTPINYDINETF